MPDALALHSKAQFPLDERLHEEREKAQGEERLDACLALEEDRCDLVHGLQLLEALLDAGLVLVRFQDLRWREAAVVGQQRDMPSVAWS